MSTSTERSLEGGCLCKYIRYRLTGDPLIVQCCHCTWCQRETGSAFVINALFASEHVTHLGGEPNVISTPTASGKGQEIARCPKCYGAVWSNYGGAGPLLRFVRVGTWDSPHEATPEVHVFTASKVPWVELPKDVPAYEGPYDAGKVWSKEVDERRHAMMERIQAQRAKQEP
ncbi:glutathione-dependent formaldehyde-activating GFA [Westerdykella ornata]|uniref:Glutathione-dependent formaldehyde-activating GFA n=1 Tax=Westerdykella ornata TaxID=318751 RepID=A0A6A6JCW4_WESOR|nr:glutathione-dependent formaldehyde-activating GFA [Westerdykella ornata]KAF2273029.1 glutathione-dependent formaldehyde-activating GFA [Westerdykella ornata]